MKRLVLIFPLLLLLFASSNIYALGFCSNGPFTQHAVFQRSAGSVAIPSDSSGSYTVVIEETSTFNNCLALGVLPTISSTLSSPFNNTGNYPAPASASLPSGFNGKTAARLKVANGVHLQSFYAIQQPFSTRYCGFNGGTCTGALIKLDVFSSITFRTYTVIEFDTMNSFIGASINQFGTIGRMRMTTGLLGSIYVDLDASINYVFARSSCDLATPSQTVTLAPATVAALTPGNYVSATPFDIQLINCVAPRSLSDSSNSFVDSLIRVSFVPASGQLVAGSTTDLRPLDQGSPGVANGVAFRLRQRSNGIPLTLDGQTTLSAPLGTRHPSDTTETFQLEAGLIKIDNETVTPGNVSGAVTFEVEYR